MSERVRIALHGNGRGTVHVGDHEISRGLQRITLDATARDLPRVTLHLVAVDVEVDGEATVMITPDAEKALLALGWTPPVVVPPCEGCRSALCPDCGGAR